MSACLSSAQIIKNESQFIKYLFFVVISNPITMKKYRKADQYYEDQYDRMTIQELKQVEKESPVPIRIPTHKVGKLLKVSEDYNPTTPFYERAVQLAQNKQDIISSWKEADERKDQQIRIYPPPTRSCIVCNLRMAFDGLLFRSKEKEWLYIYDCPKERNHRKVYYTNGHEYYIEEPKCKECGGELLSKNRRTKYKTVCKDICKNCGKVTVDEFDLTPNKPIKEKDRKKYCKDFEGRLTSRQGFEKLLTTIGKIMNKKKAEDELLEVSKIETLTIAQLEQKVTSLLEKLKYTKFQLGIPQPGRFLAVGFSLQDNSGKTEKETMKELTKLFHENLLHTNWRLIKSEITYQLGFITGKIRGYSDEDGLLKLVKEIKNSEEKTGKK